MRVNYSEEEDYPGQFDLWQANCRRSRQGRKGRAALKKLEAALEQMPIKRLEHNVLVEPDGLVCAIGAQMVQEGIDQGLTREEAVARAAEIDQTEVEEEGVNLGMPRLVAWSVAVENDEFRRQTPEERYGRMINWVRAELAKKRPTAEN